MNNLVPDSVLQGECKDIEDLQTRLQNNIPDIPKERAALFA